MKTDIPVSSFTEESESNWKEINNALERFIHVQETVKKLGTSMESAVKASIIAAMNLTVAYTEGDPYKANSIIVTFMHKMWMSVCTGLRKSAEEAIKSGVGYGQKLTPKELESMKALVVNMEMVISAHHSMTADEISETLKAQDALAKTVQAQAAVSQPISVVRALIVMAQQFILFDMQGDITAAKTAFEDQQLYLWEIAIANAQNIVKAITEANETGPVEDKAN